MSFYLNERTITTTESEDETTRTTTKSTNIKMNKAKTDSPNDIKNNSYLHKLSPSDNAKRSAAISCGEEEVKSGMNLGIGSGTTMKFLIDWLHEAIQNGRLKNVKCVPTSFQVFYYLK